MLSNLVRVEPKEPLDLNCQEEKEFSAIYFVEPDYLEEEIIVEEEIIEDEVLNFMQNFEVKEKNKPRMLEIYCRICGI